MRADSRWLSGEMIVLIVLPRKDGTGEVNVTVRGMSPIGFKLRPDIGLADGRWFNQVSAK